MKNILTNNIRTILLLSSCLLLLSACSSLTQRIEAPTVSLAGIEPLQMTLFEQQYRLQLRIQNPNDFDLPLKAIHYALDINGSKFANGASRSSVTIPTYDSAIVEVDVISRVFSLFSQIKQFALQGNGELEYRLTGDVVTELWDQSIPFEYQGNLNLNPANQ
jgi:LEA14-like dessication related protein